MAIIVEDGTIVESANSYTALATADAYHELMGNTAWADFSDDVKEAALVRGTLMLESRYRDRWIGSKTNNDNGDPKVAQLLAWPRRKDRTIEYPENFGDTDGTSTLNPLKDADYIDIGVNSIPVQVQQACNEVAFMAASDNALIPNVVGRDRYLLRTKVDVIEQSFSKDAPAVDRFPLIDQLLQSLANVGGINLTMVVGVTQMETDSMENNNATDSWLDSLGSGSGGGG